jgi:hypothetical protein
MNYTGTRSIRSRAPVFRHSRRCHTNALVGFKQGVTELSYSRPVGSQRPNDPRTLQSGEPVALSRCVGLKQLQANLCTACYLPTRTREM